MDQNRKKIDRYEIVKELGRGGMATVFHAYDPRFERDVALKILPKALLHDPQFRTRFDREAKTIGTLEHPAIVPVYDFGEDDGQPFIIMRLMGGGSLTDKLKSGPMTPEEAEKVIVRLGQALDAAHQKNIVHRDLKPGNILFDSYGNAFLSDFGIARLAGQDENLTGSSIIGTPAYMSPEQVQGEQGIDGRSDLYALGIILYHILTKQMPYKADTPAKLMMAHLLEPVPDIKQIRPDMPDGIAQVIQNAMQKNPDDRYLSGQAFGDDYSKVLRGGVPTMTISASELEAEPTMPMAGRTIQTRTTISQPPTQVRKTPVVATSPAKPRSKTLLYVILGLLLVGAMVVGSMFAMGTIGTGANEPTAIAQQDEPTNTAEPTATEPEITVTPISDEAALALTHDAEAATTEAEPLTPIPEITEEPTPTIEPTPAIPIEGGADKIAFVSDGDIWAANLDGSDLIQLTTDGAKKTNLEWTPDGEWIAYITGSCIKLVALDLSQDILACFESAEFLDTFAFSRDASQIAISLNRELFIVPFDLATLQDVRRYTHLQDMATCAFFAPLDRGVSLPVKEVAFSKDGTLIAAKVISAGSSGLQEDVIQVYSITECVEKVDRLDGFPSTRFTIEKFELRPILPSFSWDGEFLFVTNGIIRNDIFGDLYIYDMDRKRGDKINPINGRCCYTDATWSPDGRFLFFAFQDFALGAEATTVFYYVHYATLGAGGNIAPMNLPALINPKEAPQVAFRPARP